MRFVRVHHNHSTMKNPTKSLVLLTGAVLFSLSNINAVETDPVGFVTIDLPAGNSTLAMPLVTANAFAGETTGIAEGGGETVFTFSGGLSAGAYDEGTSYPTHYLMITTAGANQGVVLDVISNTATTVTVASEVVTSLGLSSTETVVVRSHTTVGDIFTGATGLTGFVDSLSFFNDDGSQDTYLWSGTNFVDGGFASQDARPVYPGQGLIFFCGAPVSIVNTGSVSTTPVQIPVYSGSAVNFVGTVTPSDNLSDGTTPVTLGSLGFGSQLTGFVGSVKFFSADGALTSASSDTYLWDGSVFRDEFFGDASSVVVPDGAAIVVSNDTPVYISMPEAY